jgi:hypothetical protein
VNIGYLPVDCGSGLLWDSLVNRSSLPSLLEGLKISHVLGQTGGERELIYSTSFLAQGLSNFTARLPVIFLYLIEDIEQLLTYKAVEQSGTAVSKPQGATGVSDSI